MTLFDSSASDVPWQATCMVRGNSFRRALNALPHDGTLGGGANRPRRGLRSDARIEASAAVVAALRIRIVEVVQDARDLHALVFVQLVLEDAERPAAVVEHQVLADEPARIRQTVRKARVRGHQQQPRRLGAVGAHDDRTGALKTFAPIAIEVRHAGRAALVVGFDPDDVAVGPHFAPARRFRFRNDGRQRRRLCAALRTRSRGRSRNARRPAGRGTAAS